MDNLENQVDSLLNYTIARISALEPDAGAKLQQFTTQSGPVFQARAEQFFRHFQRFLESKGLTFDYGIECYIKMRDSMALEHREFLQNQKYSSTSFAEVAARVYHNPDVMQHHMYGLVFAQFLWPMQYHRYSFFCDTFPSYAPRVTSYLELGGGHALYTAEADSILAPTARIDVVDISASSLELAQGMMPDSRIVWHHADIFDYVPERQYDFITIGEVLEHLEDPLAMLRRIRELLAPNGSAYVTTPANAPMIDHIYLFNNAQEIRDMLAAAGFAIESETSMFASPISPARAEKLKVPLMYAAFVKPA